VNSLTVLVLVWDVISRDPPIELTELVVEDCLGAYLGLDEGLCVQSWFEYGASMPGDGIVGVISPD
jgi:hypothetical protein